MDEETLILDDILAASFAIRQSETILARSCEALPQATEWQRIANQIDAPMIFARADFAIDSHIKIP